MMEMMMIMMIIIIIIIINLTRQVFKRFVTS